MMFYKQLVLQLPPLPPFSAKTSYSGRRGDSDGLIDNVLIMSCTSCTWINCSSPDCHPYYNSTIVRYINVSRLEYDSFNFITSISYCYSIIVFLSPPCRSHWPSWPYLKVPHFLVQVLLFCFLLCLFLSKQTNFLTFLGQFLLFLVLLDHLYYFLKVH